MELWQKIDSVDREQARELLRACCGARRWVEGMLARRPFGGRDALLTSAREVWHALSADDWREAFAHHPQIGDRESLARRFPATHRLSAQEQAGVDAAPQDVLTALAEANREYQEKFSYIFIVCATGKSAEEMLAILRERVQNDPDDEIRIAAEEQARITEHRLSA
jgi:2-oxo-4-hydroxy-4-carboxy-5-ureidoimidazoline decarboxylase